MYRAQPCPTLGSINRVSSSTIRCMSTLWHCTSPAFSCAEYSHCNIYTNLWLLFLHPLPHPYQHFLFFSFNLFATNKFSPLQMFSQVKASPLLSMQTSKLLSKRLAWCCCHACLLKAPGAQEWQPTRMQLQRPIN